MKICQQNCQQTQWKRPREQSQITLDYPGATCLSAAKYRGRSPPNPTAGTIAHCGKLALRLESRDPCKLVAGLMQAISAQKSPAHLTPLSFAEYLSRFGDDHGQFA